MCDSIHQVIHPALGHTTSAALPASCIPAPTTCQETGWVTLPSPYSSYASCQQLTMRGQRCHCRQARCGGGYAAGGQAVLHLQQKLLAGIAQAWLPAAGQEHDVVMAFCTDDGVQLGVLTQQQAQQVLALVFWQALEADVLLGYQHVYKGLRQQGEAPVSGVLVVWFYLTGQLDLKMTAWRKFRIKFLQICP